MDRTDYSTWSMVNEFIKRSDERRHRRADIRTMAISDLVARTIHLQLMSMLNDDDDDFYDDDE